jgi:CheY-like chemotaxis protein
MPTRIKILHLEDSIKDAELIHSIIEEDRIEHDYFLADNKTDFLKILTSSNIDIILSDYSLPDYNGKEALAVSRKKYPTIPFIFISGTMGEDAAINAMLGYFSDVDPCFGDIDPPCS